MEAIPGHILSMAEARRVVKLPVSREDGAVVQLIHDIYTQAN
jgi:hypothetical protein